MSRVLEQKLRSLNIRYTLVGFVPHEDALRLLAGFYTLVLPSIRISTTESSIPIKIIEAWALGVPVIATRHKVLDDRFKDREDLIFCEPEVKDIADNISLLLGNRELRDELAERSIRLANGFDYERIALRLLEQLRELAKEIS